ncbi:hypothetical protein [Roseiterribacter gracilis]|uniref:Uncharacterized protein n=1 Tax=Roseiterribacter gracilis TaxID=2812848 RepID=A0A8S8XAN6_9PROT|nr:hypothetical protein TMPK1_05370 [Rhodospirillales bacterium TMPK1]
MAAGNGTLPTLGSVIGHAETALTKLYDLRAQADAAKDTDLSAQLAAKSATFRPA